MITIAPFGRKFDVVFASDWQKMGYFYPDLPGEINQHLQFCLIRKHGEVHPTHVGVAVSNPHEALDNDYAKRIAFKRAAESFILSLSIKYPIWYKLYHKHCLAEFRRAYYFATKE